MQSSMRDKLVELIKQKSCMYNECKDDCSICDCVEICGSYSSIESLADHLLANDVIVSSEVDAEARRDSYEKLKSKYEELVAKNKELQESADNTEEYTDKLAIKLAERIVKLSGVELIPTFAEKVKDRLFKCASESGVSTDTIERVLKDCVEQFTGETSPELFKGETSTCKTPADCRFGDTLYVLLGGHILTATVSLVEYTCNGVFITCSFEELTYDETFFEDDFGRTIFFSYKEAEVARTSVESF